MSKANKYSLEVGECTVRKVQEHRNEYPSPWAMVESIAAKIGCSANTLHRCVRKYEVDTGLCDCIASEELARIKALEREVEERRKANEILKLVSAFSQAEFDRRLKSRGRSSTGTASPTGLSRTAKLCSSPRPGISGVPRSSAIQQLRCTHDQCDDSLIPRIKRVWQANLQRHGTNKVWQQMNLEGLSVSRWTVERRIKHLVLKALGTASSCAAPTRIRRCRVRLTGAAGSRPENLTQ